MDADLIDYCNIDFVYCVTGQIVILHDNDDTIFAGDCALSNNESVAVRQCNQFARDNDDLFAIRFLESVCWLERSANYWNK